MKAAHLLLALTLASTIAARPVKLVKRIEGEDPDVAENGDVNNAPQNLDPEHVNADGSNQQQAQNNFDNQFNGGNDEGNDSNANDDNNDQQDNVPGNNDQQDQNLDNNDENGYDPEQLSQAESFIEGEFFRDSFDTEDDPVTLESYYKDGKFDFQSYKADGYQINGNTMMSICAIEDPALLTTLQTDGFGFKFLQQMKPTWNRLAGDAGLNDLSTLGNLDAAATQSIRNAARDWFGAGPAAQVKISTIVSYAVKTIGAGGVSAVIYWLGELASQNIDFDQTVNDLYQKITSDDPSLVPSRKRWSDVD